MLIGGSKRGERARDTDKGVDGGTGRGKMGQTEGQIRPAF
jgi:hypothetical protein